MIQQIADGQYPERFKFLPDFCSHAFQYGNIGVKNIQIATPLSFHSVSKTAVSPGNGMRPRSNILFGNLRSQTLSHFAPLGVSVMIMPSALRLSLISSARAKFFSFFA